MKKRIVSLLTISVLTSLFAGTEISYARQHQKNYDEYCSVTSKCLTDTGIAVGRGLCLTINDTETLSEFQQQKLANRKALLTEKVEANKITQEQATQVVESVQQDQANCQGYGTGETGQGAGMGHGMHNGQGNGHRGGHQGDHTRNRVTSQ